MRKIFKITEEQYKKLEEAVKDSIFMGRDNDFPQNRCDTMVTSDGKTRDGFDIEPAKPKTSDKTAAAAVPNPLFRKSY